MKIFLTGKLFSIFQNLIFDSFGAFFMWFWVWFFCCWYFLSVAKLKVTPYDPRTYFFEDLTFETISRSTYEFFEILNFYKRFYYIFWGVAYEIWAGYFCVRSGSPARRCTVLVFFSVYFGRIKHLQKSVLYDQHFGLLRPFSPFKKGA